MKTRSQFINRTKEELLDWLEYRRILILQLRSELAEEEKLNWSLNESLSTIKSQNESLSLELAKKEEEIAKLIIERDEIKSAFHHRGQELFAERKVRESFEKIVLKEDDIF